VSGQFWWRYTGADGQVLGIASERFAAQPDAEAWFSDTWQELLEDGVEAATLLADETVIYGPMSLRP
jgi:hypothetical protein